MEQYALLLKENASSSAPFLWCSRELYLNITQMAKSVSGPCLPLAAQICGAALYSCRNGVLLVSLPLAGFSLAGESGRSTPFLDIDPIRTDLFRRSHLSSLMVADA
jgi:hypothetical protein